MKKSDFIKKVNQMKNPVLEEASSPYYDLLNCYLTISDSKHTVITEVVKLSHKEYNENNLQDYYKRERKLKTKYLKWLHDVFGSYFTDRIRLL